MNRRKNWQRKPLCRPALKSWLIDQGSLTARLKTQFADFAVQPLSQTWAKANRDEYEMLGLKSSQNALVRKVVLIGDGIPKIFAHSVMPQASLRGAWRGFNLLGNRSLGAALFANPQVKREKLQFCTIGRAHPLYAGAMQHLALQNSKLWARRSLFRLKRAKILVTEVFVMTDFHLSERF